MAANLIEKYRPGTLDDVIGQEAVVYQLREWLAAPCEAAFIFEGETGAGKSSAAFALAMDLGCELAEMCGGYREIPAGEQTADNIRTTIDAMYTQPMMGSPAADGRKWRVLLIDEADRMNQACEYLWLSILEDIPPATLIVFTTNHAAKFGRRFLDRCERFTFNADGEAAILAAQARVNEIWRAETGRTDAPRVDDLPGAIVDGKVSYRACVQALTPLIRKARPRPEAPKVANPAVRPAVASATMAPRPAPTSMHVRNVKTYAEFQAAIRDRVTIEAQGKARGKLAIRFKSIEMIFQDPTRKVATA